MPTTDKFQYTEVGLDAPARSAATVTPSDTTPLAQMARGLWVGTQGDITVVMADGNAQPFPSAIGWMPIRVSQVKATGTTASGIVAVW